MSLLEQELSLTRPIDEPELELVLALAKSAELVRAELTEALAEHGLGLQQYHVLRALRPAGSRGLTLAALADCMIEPSSNVTRLVDRLSARGLTERLRADADKRLVRARLTPTGESLLGALTAPLRQARRRACGGLTPTEMTRLCELLEKLRRGIYAR